MAERHQVPGCPGVPVSIFERRRVWTMAAEYRRVLAECAAPSPPGDGAEFDDWMNTTYARLCDATTNVEQLRAWHREFVRGRVGWTWAHLGPLYKDTAPYSGVLERLNDLGFISTSGAPDARPVTASGHYEYLEGFLRRDVLARLDLAPPLVVVWNGGRTMADEGFIYELPATSSNVFFPPLYFIDDEHNVCARGDLVPVEDLDDGRESVPEAAREELLRDYEYVHFTRGPHACAACGEHAAHPQRFFDFVLERVAAAQ